MSVPLSQYQVRYAVNTQIRMFQYPLVYYTFKYFDSSKPIRRLFVCLLFYVSLKNFHLYGDVTTVSEGLQNLSLCSVLRAFEQGEIFIVSHLLRRGTLVFPVSSEGPPHSVVSYDTLGDVEDLV